MKKFIIKEWQEKNHTENTKEIVTESHMTIGDMGSAVVEFTDFLKTNKKHMDNDTVKHLKQAWKYIDMAMRNEADAHGTDYTGLGNL